MLDNILNTANLYADGLKKVEERRIQWLKKHTELKAHLKQIADHLNANAGYRQGFFIDSLHAFDEDMNGTCVEMPSLTFRSGDMPMLVTFKNSLGERKEFVEQGFRITFNPVITGEVLVLLLPHDNDMNKTTAQFTTLALIKDPGQFTMEMADEIIMKGMETAFYTSFTGIAEIQRDTEQEPLQAPQHHTIGFKRYETTEKAN